MVIKLNRKGVSLNGEERNKENENLGLIEQEFDRVDKNVEATRAQLDEVSSKGTIDPAVTQMKVDTEGVVHLSPDARLRSDYSKVNKGLSQKVPIAEQIKGKPNQKFQLIGGTVRKTDNTGWGFVEDTLHAKTGLATVSDASYDLVIGYGFTAKKVGSLIVAPDEELAMKGVTCGASVGTTSSNIRIAMPMSIKTKGRTSIVDIDSILAPYCSIEQLADLSGYKLTHTYAVANNANDVPVTQVQSSFGSAEAEGLEVRTIHNQSSIEVRAYANLHGYVSYSTSTSSTSVSTNNTNKPAVLWDSATSAIKVTPELINNQYDINISGINTPYMAVLFAKTTTYFSVRFYNLTTGALITVPDNNMKFVYTSGSKVSNAMPTDMVINIRRGPLTLRPSLFNSATGNLWIQGIMEVD